MLSNTKGAILPPDPKDFELLICSGFRDQDTFFGKHLKVIWPNSFHPHTGKRGAYVCLFRTTKRKHKRYPATGRTNVSVQLRSIQHSSSFPFSHLVFFLSLCLLFSSQKLPLQSPLVFPNLTSFFSYIIYHCFLFLPTDLASHTRARISSLSSFLPTFSLHFHLSFE